MPKFEERTALVIAKPFGCMVRRFLPEARLHKGMDCRSNGFSFVAVRGTYNDFILTIRLFFDDARLRRVTDEEESLAFFDTAFMNQMGEIKFFSIFGHVAVLLNCLSVFLAGSLWS